MTELILYLFGVFFESWVNRHQHHLTWRQPQRPEETQTQREQALREVKFYETTVIHSTIPYLTSNKEMQLCKETAVMPLNVSSYYNKTSFNYHCKLNYLNSFYLFIIYLFLMVLANNNNTNKMIQNSFSPLPGVVLREDGDHSLHGAQDGAVNDHRSGLVIPIFPATVQTVKTQTVKPSERLQRVRSCSHPTYVRLKRTGNWKSS